MDIATKPATYLLVEDDESQACLLRKWLKKAAEPFEIDVIMADNLADGVRLSNDLRPGTTFLDIHLPLVKGGPVEQDWHVIADAIPRMIPPVIVITASDITPELKLYCMTKNGAHHVYQKPYNEGFFARLRDDMKLFGAKLLSAAGDAELRSSAGGDDGREGTS